MENLHPSAQVALIVMGGIVAIVCVTAIFTDFWDNIGRKNS
jgi:hypothetical protein